MTITIRSFYLDIVTNILLNDVRLATGKEMHTTGYSELEITQETDTLYPQWIQWISDATGAALITGQDIVRL